MNPERSRHRFSKAALTAAAAMVAAATLPGAVEGQVLAPATGAVIAAEAPLSLTASDGTGLELVSLRAKAVVEDPLAFTELHLAFRNGEDRVREGRFRITLPHGATVSRFAMRIGDHWQEGEVVELQAARVAYEDFLHRRQDPALLETEAGNEFSARVFPIQPRAVKELIVSYSQELPRSHEPYRLPLRGLPRLGSLEIRGLVGKTELAAPDTGALTGRQVRHEVVELARRDFLPDRDFEIVPPRSQRMGLRHENLVVARVTPLAQGTAPARPLSSLAVLVDTSASRALGFADQLGRLQALLAELGRRGDPQVAVLAFDQDLEAIYTGRASGFGDEPRRRLSARRALGASDLGRALAALGPGGKHGRFARVLLVSDGVATAGELTAEKLRVRARALASAGIQRLDVLAVGGIRDDENLRRLATAGLPEAGLVLDARTTPGELVSRLTRATRSGLTVRVPGARWVWPEVLNGIQPGDEVLLYADLPPDQPFQVTIAGVPVPGGTLASGERPLLERAWVRARLSRLLAQRDAAGGDADLAEGLRQQAIQLSVRHRVLCPLTALLVLETEHDYARFGIDRRALADILTVDAGGLAVVNRRGQQPPTAVIAGRSPEPEAPRITEAPPAGPRRRLDNDRERPRTEPAAAPAPARDEAKARAVTAGAPSATRAEEPVAAAPATPPPSPAEARPAAPPRPSPSKPRSVVGGAAEEPATADSAAPEARAQRPARRMSESAGIVRDQPAITPAGPSGSPYEGRFEEVMALLRKGSRQQALTRAFSWRDEAAGDVLALVALGEAAEALGQAPLAARAYGSIVDLFPGRADLRRFAGGRLERLATQRAMELAIDTYRQAVEQRPDHPASHRLLAFALVRAGRPADAFSALAAGVSRSYPPGRFRGAERILREDLGLIAAAWMRAEPARASRIREQLRQAGGVPEQEPSLRFVLTWETDANDVDFHIRDGQGGHAYFSQPQLRSGGVLYADVTTGYGPECFTIRGQAARRATPYRLEAHYYRRGPMGYGMGKLQILDHDGQGNLRFEERPFVVMRDGAYVDLGTVAASRPAAITVK